MHMQSLDPSSNFASFILIDCSCPNFCHYSFGPYAILPESLLWIYSCFGLYPPTGGIFEISFSCCLIIDSLGTLLKMFELQIFTGILNYTPPIYLYAD